MESADITKEAAIQMVPVMQADGLELLEQLVMDNHCKTFLEIGTAVARTAVRMAELGLQVVTIEKDPDMASQARANIVQSPVGSRITLLEGDAREVEVTGTYDCIFIDAAKAQYEKFFARYSRLLSKDGIIVTDNMKFHGLVDHPEWTHNRHTKSLIRHLQAYRKFLESQTEWETQFLDDKGDGIAITRRKS